MTELAELRAQLRRVIELTTAAAERPTPTNAVEAGELVAAIETSSHAFHVLMAQMERVQRHLPPATDADARELVALVMEVRRAGERLTHASRAALEAARRHAAN